ncbi:MAG: hypothetical protein RDV41_02975, partial [Planctomycetota bacterium]|nr:hypothetical protein [Planctomycetota bacterium]
YGARSYISGDDNSADAVFLYNYGVYSDADGASTGGGAQTANYALYGYAHGSQAGGQTDNYAVYGNATTGSANYGGYFTSTGPGSGTQYGLYANASGGTTNWAGYFMLGNVNVEGNLYINENGGD